ncbi:hypothetical protein DPMN_032754 [Dreissena polymorpha]|uniref:Uncharacterized protein n=1 Tax=Dreissena polymorpha TaxID=45954 RepID=A0A9D4M2H7_DREPO|nr:hypothetical protein DPMN_032754 [Dreissena polymorpha]
MARQRPTRGAPGLIMGPCIVEIDRIVIRYGAPGLVMGPCIVESDRIVIRDVQYQFEVNRCRNEEVIVKCNFGWAWSMWAGRPRIDCIVITNVQYQFVVNRCTNKKVNFQGSMARTDRRTAEITTISPRFSKSDMLLDANGEFLQRREFEPDEEEEEEEEEE